MTFSPTPRPRRSRQRIARATAIAGVALGLAGLAFAGTPAFAADAFFPPVANDDAYEMVQGTVLDTTVAQGLLANDTVGDAGPLEVDAVWSDGAMSVFPGGDFWFTPDPGFTGAYTFQYTVIDKTSHLVSNKATVTITVTPKPNGAPVAHPDVYSVVQGGTLHIDAPGVLANDTDPEGDPLTVAAVQGHNSAEVVLNSAGWLTYTPDPAFTGVTTFQYRASDGHQSSDWTTVTITVTDTKDGSGPEPRPTPSTPKTPETPETPETPKAPETPGRTLAQTGGDIPLGLTIGGGSLAALGAAVAGITAWRRRHDVA